MRRMLDRLADRVARKVLAWSAGRVDPARRVWIKAMRAELNEVDGGWARLGWAVGGLGVVWMTRNGAVRREHRVWPEAARIVAGGIILGVLSLIVFATKVPDVERTPAGLLFGVLALYFAAAGFLSSRRTRHIGPGIWAGAACGLAFAIVVCIDLFTTAASVGVGTVAQGGLRGLLGVAWGALGFFTLLGAACGGLGARAAR